MTIEMIEKFEAVGSSDRRLQANKWDDREKRMVIQAIKIIWEYAMNNKEFHCKFSNDENIDWKVRNIISEVWSSLQQIENYKECKKQWIFYHL